MTTLKQSASITAVSVVAVGVTLVCGGSARERGRPARGPGLMQASVLRRLDTYEIGPVGRTVQAILFSRSVLALGAVLLGLAMTD